jgi:heme O synthase-like polyprenyltransferase
MRKALVTLFKYLGRANMENGEPSNMRVIVMYSAFLFSSALSFTMIYVTICYPNLLLGMAAIVSGLLTSILGWKAYQKSKESPAPVGLTEGKKEGVQ